MASVLAIAAAVTCVCGVQSLAQEAATPARTAIALDECVRSSERIVEASVARVVPWRKPMATVLPDAPLAEEAPFVLCELRVARTYLGPPEQTALIVRVMRDADPPIALEAGDQLGLWFLTETAEFQRADDTTRIRLQKAVGCIPHIGLGADHGLCLRISGAENHRVVSIPPRTLELPAEVGARSPIDVGRGFGWREVDYASLAARIASSIESQSPRITAGVSTTGPSNWFSKLSSSDFDAKARSRFLRVVDEQRFYDLPERVGGTRETCAPIASLAVWTSRGTKQVYIHGRAHPAASDEQPSDESLRAMRVWTAIPGTDAPLAEWYRVP